MKDLKKVKYLILDMDGCVYHPKYLKTLFGQVSTRMTEFISIKLGIDKIKAKEIQADYFYKYDTSLNGLMKNYPDLIDAKEFLKYVHNINYVCLDKDTVLREQLLKLDLKIAFLGALAFGFSSYLYIIIGAGHNTKVHAIAYMAPTIAAMIFCYRDKRLLGFFLTFLFPF